MVEGVRVGEREALALPDWLWEGLPVGEATAVLDTTCARRRPGGRGGRSGGSGARAGGGAAG